MIECVAAGTAFHMGTLLPRWSSTIFEIVSTVPGGPVHISKPMLAVSERARAVRPIEDRVHRRRGSALKLFVFIFRRTDRRIDDRGGGEYAVVLFAVSERARADLPNSNGC